MLRVLAPVQTAAWELTSHDFVTTGFVPGAATPPVVQIWNPRRTAYLLFSGEDFSAGMHAYQADANAFWDAWNANPAAFLAGLNGWFCGTLVDLERKTASLFNDRYGMGRLYYAESRGKLYFATSARALLAVLSNSRELVPQSLAESISVGCVMQNRTLFRDIHLLPVASLWTFHADGRLQKARYFDPSEWAQQERLDAAAYNEELRRIFARVVPRYDTGTEVGLSLTGGLDSRMVLAWSRRDPRTLPCYTFGGPYRDCADVRIARKLAKSAGHSHDLLEFGEDFFSEFSALAHDTIKASDGTMDVSGAVELYMNRLARKIAPIRLTGNYGSEILRANVAFRPRRLDRTLYTPDFNRLLDVAEETYRAEAQDHRLSFIAFKQVPWHHHSRYSVERSVLTPRSPFLDNELVKLAYRVPENLQTSPAPLLNLIAAGSPAMGKMASDRAHRHGALSVVNQVQRLWHEFTAKAEYAYDYGMPPWLVHADRMASGLALERLFLGRHKFYHFRTWYSGRLSGFLRELPVDGLPEGCFRQGAARTLIKDHTARRANHTLDLHRVASLTLIGVLTRNC